MSVISSATGVFRRLRMRLTLAFLLTGFVGFLVLVGVIVVRDSVEDAARVDAMLLGEASRAAGMVYEDGQGVTAEAVAGDHMRGQAAGLLIVDLKGDRDTVLYTRGGVPATGWQSLARECVTDPAEDGALGRVGGNRVAGVPWRGATSDSRPRGCALTFLPEASITGGGVALAAGLGSMVLLTVLSSIVWWAAGRSLGAAEGALADRERFLASAAHEMRGPLARIRAVAENALAGVDSDAPVASSLRTLVSTADQAGRVATNLLLASRIEHAEVPVQSRRLRLDELAFEVETLVDGVVVDVTEPVEVDGDPMLLRQAILNLVDNAVRHGHRDGEHPTVILTVVRREGPVVRVADDGPGMPAGMDVLQPYVSGPRGGNGLGLPLVQWIARRHGATLWIGSADGVDGLRGAAVEIRFPTEVG